MTDVDAIHTKLAAAAATVTGLRAYASLPGSINPPVFAPTEFELTYNKNFGTAAMIELVITCGVFTSLGDTDRGRKLLLGYLTQTGATSVKAAIEADRTLTGVAKTLLVERVRGAYRLYEIAGVEYLGAMLDVRVWG